MSVQPSLELLISRLREIRAQHGLRPMMVALNSVSAFRFSAVNRFDDDLLRNTCFYDREDPRIDSLPTIPTETSYCRYVRERRHMFLLPDAAAEVLLQSHPRRHEVRAYCGAPLVAADGQVVGTICHFNVTPVTIADSDAQLLRAAAGIVMAWDKMSPR